MVKRFLLFLAPVLLFGCGVMVETRKVSDCTVTDDPTGKFGKLNVVCSDLKLSILYDNIPDGRDPLILKVVHREAKKLEEEYKEPYTVLVGGEVLEGWAYKEVWSIGRYTLEGFEYFVNGGTACYEEEEGYSIVLVKEGKRITLAKFYQEDTDCGGA